MGGPSKSLEKAQINAANSQTKLGEDYAAMRKKALGTMDTLYAAPIAYDTGVVNAANSGDYSKLVGAAGPAIGNVSQQFDAAKRTMLQTIPQGPGRDQALASLPIAQANATAGTLNATYQNALDKLTQMGASYGGVGLQESGAALSGYQGGATTLGNVAQQHAEGKASTMNFLGQLAGAGGNIAAAAMGCWIAEAIYGYDDTRTHLLRAYLNGPFAARFPGSIVMWVYRKIGKQVAWFVERSPFLQRCLRPLFERALRSAVQYVEQLA